MKMDRYIDKGKEIGREKEREGVGKGVEQREKNGIDRERTKQREETGKQTDRGGGEIGNSK